MLSLKRKRLAVATADTSADAPGGIVADGSSSAGASLAGPVRRFDSPASRAAARGGHARRLARRTRHRRTQAPRAAQPRI